MLKRLQRPEKHLDEMVQNGLFRLLHQHADFIDEVEESFCPKWLNTTALKQDQSAKLTLYHSSVNFCVTLASIDSLRGVKTALHVLQFGYSLFGDSMNDLNQAVSSCRPYVSNRFAKGIQSCIPVHLFIQYLLSDTNENSCTLGSAIFFLKNENSCMAHFLNKGSNQIWKALLPLLSALNQRLACSDRNNRLSNII